MRNRIKFSYADSLANSRDFRLLKLVPASSLKADVHCQLGRYSLINKPPRYEALSYRWSSDESRHRITLNRAAFYIRSNLHEALRRPRRENQPRIVWVDAICINQDDVDEKETQIPMMRRIYATAERVLVWVGEASFDSDSAIDFIPKLTEVAKEDCAERWFRLLAKEDFLRKLFSLVRWFWRSWWGRTWVIQEVVLAKEVIVLCGSRQIPWSVIYIFVTTWMDIKFSPYHGTLYQPEIDHLQMVALRTMGMAMVRSSEALSNARRTFQPSNSGTPSAALVHLLWSFKYQEVTDLRDKIYGLLGLARKQDRNRITVDYRQSVEDLYNAVFRLFLTDDNGLDAFRWMTGETLQMNHLTLPSWVPDYGSRGVRPVSSFITQTDSPAQESKRSFSAAGVNRSRCRSQPQTIRFESNYQILVLQGYIVDVVMHLGRVCPCGDDFALNRQRLYPTLEAWRLLATQTWAERYASGLEDAFWRTVLTDRKIEGFHFEDRAGWIPAKRLSKHDAYIPPKSSEELGRLIRAIELRGLVNGASGRRFCTSAKGYFCLLPANANKGDLICVLLGGEVPYVLRSQGNQYYKMIGECYVHGIMDGEVIKGAVDGKYQSFKLQ